jgi:hypothetical protein
MTFEKLTYWLTGSQCKTTQRSIGIRVGLGLFVSTVLFGLTLIFAAAGAGNSGASSTYWSIFIPTCLLFVAYFIGAIALYSKGNDQKAQYLAWSPVLVLLIFQIVKFILLLIV